VAGNWKTYWPDCNCVAGLLSCLQCRFGLKLSVLQMGGRGLSFGSFRHGSNGWKMLHHCTKRAISIRDDCSFVGYFGSRYPIPFSATLIWRKNDFEILHLIGRPCHSLALNTSHFSSLDPWLSANVLGKAKANKQWYALWVAKKLDYSITVWP